MAALFIPTWYGIAFLLAVTGLVLAIRLSKSDHTMRIPPNDLHQYEGEAVSQITDLAFLIRFRQVHNPQGIELQTVNAQIRHLQSKGYGRCRPTPKLPCQLKAQCHGKAI